MGEPKILPHPRHPRKHDDVVLGYARKDFSFMFMLAARREVAVDRNEVVISRDRARYKPVS